jgi:uncharacterized protein DUF6767
MTHVGDDGPARDPDPACPIRVGDLCKLCVPGATGPENCGLVYLVVSDPDLLADLLDRWN